MNKEATSNNELQDGELDNVNGGSGHVVVGGSRLIIVEMVDGATDRSAPTKKDGHKGEIDLLSWG